MRRMPGDGHKSKAPDKTEKLDKQSAKTVISTPRMYAGSVIDLGTLLLKEKLIDEQRLAEALSIQEENHNTEKLGEILVRNKWITEEQITELLGRQLGIPVIKTLNEREIDPELVAKIPIQFAKKNEIVPIQKENGYVKVAISDPLNLAALDDIRILLHSDISPVLATPKMVIDAINKSYDRSAPGTDGMDEFDAIAMDDNALNEPVDLLEADDEAPIIRLVNSLLFRAVKERASDIHVEPSEKDVSVRFRIDGTMYEILRPPKRIQQSIASRIKLLGGLNIAEKRLPQDGRIRIKLAGKDVDIRLNTLPTAHGERIVMRLLDKTAVRLDMKILGMNPKQLEVMTDLISKPHGILLVTGPTGSGKTTTLYSALSKINTREQNIITIEDPIEYQLDGIGQIQVNEKINLTFAEGLRAILRQDPDVIMVGEIRDRETAEIAIQASLTGHLVFSTVHANDAASTITRLVDMGIEPFLISSSLLAVISQRLARRLCPHCKQPYKPDEAELRRIGLTPAQIKPEYHFYRSVGCPECFQMGYSGRVGIYEFLLIDHETSQCILKASDATTLNAIARKKGMRSLLEDGVTKIVGGLTTIEEIISRTSDALSSTEV